MSGGSFDYLYSKVEDMAAQLSGNNQPAYRRAFASHLSLVAKAMHDVEWTDDGDMGEGRDKEAIQAVLGKCAKECEIDETVKEARRVIQELQNLLPPQNTNKK